MARIKKISETVKREFKCPKCNEQATETITTVRQEAEEETYSTIKLDSKTEKPESK
jgi:transcription elongation factor Elf1